MIPKASEEDISTKMVIPVFPTSKTGCCASSSPDCLLGTSYKGCLKACTIFWLIKKKKNCFGLCSVENIKQKRPKLLRVCSWQNSYLPNLAIHHKTPGRDGM